MLSKRDELLQSDYVALEKSDVAMNAELWRISLRLGALNNVDYGQFVNSLRSVVEPVVAAYRCRSEVMNAVIAREAAQVKGLILVLGHSEPGLTGASKLSYDDSQKRDVALFAETLRNGLINNSVHKILWHNPDQMPLKEGRATSDEWGKYLSKFDCVVMLNKHSDYDIEFVKQNAKKLVDASAMIEESRLASLPTQPSVSKTPVEVGSFPGQMDVVYTGIVPVVYKAQRTLLESLIGSVAGSFVLIGMVMVCLLSPARSFLSALAPHNLLQALACGMISMIPNIFPLIIVFGLMGHMGTLVDIGTMMTASVALGIAVDDTIHFLTWFRINLRKGLDRRQAILEAYRDVAPAMTQTTIIGGLGLCVFALSTFTPTQRFGTLMLALLFVALMGDLIFLPALLSSPLGRLFSIRKSKHDTAASNPTLKLVTEGSEYRLVDEELPSGNHQGRIPQGNESVAQASGDGRASAVPPPKFLNNSNRVQARKRT